ncbi:ABC bile acid transporter [Sporothrix brasiliensis 5110]|uniref:ABC bile acid transporter n=1 Tax=Sporothrix brasiliensis 5110 TaxID=1398154 RepID=A0A0C2ICF4_9PEZI|nr:ABC bile acid transporter [Sporothrix brasiliensis 5110]KIH86986.1 ABC bile acid transporter [Sporothrix brasiliensis 5110]
MDDKSWALLHPIVGASNLGLVFLLSLPSFRQLWTKAQFARRNRGAQGGGAYEVVPQLFESADGKATEASVAAFSDRQPRLGAYLSLYLGLAASITSAILLTLATAPPASLDRPWLFAFDSWADVPAWALICLQLASTPAKEQYDQRWVLSIIAFSSSALLVGSLGYRYGYDIVHILAGQNVAAEDGLATGTAVCWLVQVLAALVATLCFATFPHRPDVYYKGDLVDQQHAVSILSRFSFDWNKIVFDIANARKLELEDLPNLDGNTRSSCVNERYLARGGSAGGPKGRLWWQLLVAYKWPLLLQWALTFVRSVLALFPQFIIYQFLEGLDSHEGGNKAANPKLWGWVIGIGVSLVLQIWIGSAQRWLTSSRLEAPLNSLVQTLIFQKALRLDEAADPGHKVAEGDGKTGNRDKKGPKKPEGDVRQSVVNHMKLDSHVMSKKYAKIQFGLMKYRDAKAHVLTEALQGMRQIKYSALEQLYEEKIIQSRNEELRQFWRVAKWMCSLSFIINTGPIMLSSISIAVYTFTTPTHVRASVIFASLGLFDQLDEAIGYLPLIQVYLMEAWTSCVRVEKYLNQPDKAPVADQGDSVVFADATVRWPRVEDSDVPANGESSALAAAPASPPPEQSSVTDNAGTTVVPEETRSILRNIDVAFPNGELSLITGKTGAGKSLLLAAILGEVKLLSGTVRVPKAPPVSVIENQNINEGDWVLPSLTAFVSQTPWVESGTLKDNILFGMPFREVRYRKVLQACALAKDIELLADGDATEVGPKGVTLSGGQRWRVALARALYSRAGILILDDVLSAVDTHVGRTIVNEALSGDLAKGRTRILATHHPEMCMAYASYLVRLDSGRVEGVEKIEHYQNKGLPAETFAPAQEDEPAGGDSSGATTGDGDGDGDKAANDKKKDSEDRETGRVKSRVYREYVRASKSLLLWLLILALLISSRLLSVATTWSLKELSASYDNDPSIASHRLYTQIAEPEWDWQIRAPAATFLPTVLQQVPADDDANYRKNIIFWITAYVLFDYSTLIVSIAQQLLIMFTGLRASRVLFEKMTHSILRAPLSWIDKTPTGRVLNRFTSDTFTVDRRLASDLTKRINSVAHSPVYDQFSSVLTGLSTIRAFHRTDFYMDRVFGLIDNSAKASWALQLLARWMNFRMGMFGAVFVTAVASCIVFGNVEASLAGFGLVFALRYTSSLSRLLANVTSIELGFNAAERILEYIDIDTESEGGRDVPAAWPTKGHIEVENLTVSYGPSLPPVLKELNFEVQPGERIGVVGRTGAGKSTLAAVFFRLLESQEGTIRIDNIDISTLKLDQLRSRLAIIPQDPFLFSGTLRSNLDVEDSIDDYDLHHVLKRVHLVEPQAEDGAQPSGAAAGSIVGPVARAELVEDHTGEEVARLLPSNGEETTIEEDAANPIDGTVVASDSATDVGSRTPEGESSETTAQGGSNGNSSDVDSVTKSAIDDEVNSFTNLAMPISTGGGNLSQGQRQLVCLARALLTRPKIVVLDEATSAVDRGTDSAIQESLRREFASGGCTVLVIAHRLSTVVDFDRLLVLQEGRVAEMGTPRELMERGMALDERRAARAKEVAEAGQLEPDEERSDGTGAFWELAKKSAEKEKLLEMVFGKKAPATDA